jgi:hypothetical protein
MLDRKSDAHKNNHQKSDAHANLRATDLGLCLRCGERISRCGRPFTDSITCHKCGAVNIYEDSQQPVRLS